MGVVWYSTALFNECNTYEGQAVVQNIYSFKTSAGKVLSQQLHGDLDLRSTQSELSADSLGCEASCPLLLKWIGLIDFFLNT
jgi:hypothetical protein